MRTRDAVVTRCSYVRSRWRRSIEGAYFVNTLDKPGRPFWILPKDQPVICARAVDRSVVVQPNAFLLWNKFLGELVLA
jgi:hypothetical protein